MKARYTHITEEIMSFMVIYEELKTIILGEVSQTQTDKYTQKNMVRKLNSEVVDRGYQVCLGGSWQKDTKSQ